MSEDDAKKAEPINPDELAEVWFSVRHVAFERLSQIFREKFADSGANQKLLADRLGMDQGQLSRTMRGQKNVTLRTLTNIAYAMDRSVDVSFPAFGELPKRNSSFERVHAEWTTRTLASTPPPKRNVDLLFSDIAEGSTGSNVTSGRFVRRDEKEVLAAP